MQVPIKTKQQLDTEANNFVSTIQIAVKKHTINYERRAQEVSYPTEIRERVAEKRRARKKCQNTRYLTDKALLNRLTHELTAAIKKYKQDSISGYLKELSPDKASDYSLWKATKKIKRPIIQMTPLKKGNGTWVRTNEEKGNMFADHLEKTFRPPPRQTEKENTFSVASGENCEIKYVTREEVLNQILILEKPLDWT